MNQKKISQVEDTFMAKRTIEKLKNLTCHHRHNTPCCGFSIPLFVEDLTTMCYAVATAVNTSMTNHGKFPVVVERFLHRLMNGVMFQLLVMYYVSMPYICAHSDLTWGKQFANLKVFLLRTLLQL